MTAPDPIQTLLPLTETTFYILLSLATEEKHGYAIMKEVQSLSQQQVILSTGTLYGALKRLLEQGWIERAPDTGPSENARGSQAYRLTALGQAVFLAELERMSALVRVAKKFAPGVSL